MAASAIPTCARPKLTEWRQSAAAPAADHADLAIYQGDTFAAQVDVTLEDGTPADLTGYTVASQIRHGPADLAELTAVIAANIVSPLEGSISLALTPEQTTALPTQEVLFWDLELTAEDGTITTILAGNVLVTAEVTRPEPLSEGPR